jgi:hypothetical protein
LNLLNTMDKWQRRGGFTTNTIVILLKKTAMVSFQYQLGSMFNGMEGIEIGSSSGCHIQGYMQ